MSEFVDKYNPTVDEIVNVWCKALRSRKYEQGTGRLCQHNRYCCLGVLTDIYQKEIGDLTEVDTWANIKLYDNEGSVLPTKVMEWAKLNNTAGIYGASETEKLWYDNDSGKTFSQIAGIIESKKEFLFRNQ